MRTLLVGVALLGAGCTPATPSSWLLNWIRDDAGEAFAPFDVVDGSVQSTTTVRLRQSAAAGGWVLEENVFVYDEETQQVLRDTFTVWPARIRGSAEAPRVTVSPEDPGELDEADGSCVRMEWPEYALGADEHGVYWCEGLYGAQTIWLGIEG